MEMLAGGHQLSKHLQYQNPMVAHGLLQPHASGRSFLPSLQADGVLVHVEESKKELTREVLLMTQEVGRLQRERWVQTCEFEAANQLFITRSRITCSVHITFKFTHTRELGVKT